MIVLLPHYENMPMQYIEIFFQKEKIKFSLENFNFFTQNIHGGYRIEPPQRGDSNEYPQFMFWIQNKKIRYTPANPKFFYIKVGYKGVYITWTCFRDA